MQSHQSLYQQIARVYRGTAILILNTILLAAGVEVAASSILKVWSVRNPGDQQLVNPREKIAYYRSRDWGAQYWHEHHLSDVQRYHPYVIWRRAPFQGITINIGEHGTRVTPGANCSANSYKVFAFGGSTMWGTGSPDWGTIPAYLQAGLEALRGKSVCVMNFGESAFVSTQGVIQLILELQSGNVPHLVIFYDGVNDVYAAYQWGRPTHQNVKYIAARFENSENRPSLADWIRASNAFQLIQRAASKLRHDPTKGSNLFTYKTMGVDTAGLSDSLVETYLSNYKIVDALAQKYGFRFLFFWQPNIAIGEKPLTSEEQEMRRRMDPALVELHGSVYGRVQQLGKKYKNLYYFGRIFDSLNSGIWIDPFHVIPEGNQLVAQKILDVVTARNKDNKVNERR